MLMNSGMDFTLMKALIIDDNDFVRFMLEKHLLGFGFENVAQASDGHAGLEILKEQKPDIVICDINMRPVNGYEFLKQVRLLETELSSVPVIFLTSKADEAFVKRAIELNIDGYLLKPVMPTFLKKHITMILEDKMTA